MSDLTPSQRDYRTYDPENPVDVRLFFNRVAEVAPVGIRGYPRLRNLRRCLAELVGLEPLNPTVRLRVDVDCPVPEVEVLWAQDGEARSAWLPVQAFIS